MEHAQIRPVAKDRPGPSLPTPTLFTDTLCHLISAFTIVMLTIFPFLGIVEKLSILALWLGFSFWVCVSIQLAVDGNGLSFAIRSTAHALGSFFSSLREDRIVGRRYWMSRSYRQTGFGNASIIVSFLALSLFFIASTEAISLVNYFATGMAGNSEIERQVNLIISLCNVILFLAAAIFTANHQLTPRRLYSPLLVLMYIASIIYVPMIVLWDYRTFVYKWSKKIAAAVLRSSRINSLLHWSRVNRGHKLFL